MGWIGGFAEWQDKDTQTVYLSVAFSWFADHAARRALSYRMLGWKVKVGGPGLFILKRKEHTSRHEIFDLAEYGTSNPDALLHHNPDATIASRGCPGMGTPENPDPCVFCIVPPMEGTSFTLLPDFVPRPILCDNNLSALPADYQDYIIRRYQEAGVKLKDANSGFEPVTFTQEVYERWRPILAAGGSPWRFGYDTTAEAPQAHRVMKMLESEPGYRKRPYVLIGNEPYEACMKRIHDTLDAGCDPHVQPEIKLHSKEKKYWVKHDWTYRKLIDVARWVNSHSAKNGMPFKDYDARYQKPAEFNAQEGLFV
jgi:hypothetical protein